MNFRFLSETKLKIATKFSKILRAIFYITLHGTIVKHKSHETYIDILLWYTYKVQLIPSSLALKTSPTVFFFALITYAIGAHFVKEFPKDVELKRFFSKLHMNSDLHVSGFCPVTKI